MTSPDPAAAPEGSLVAGTGPDALVHADLALGLGPHHPANHGSLRLHLTLEDARIVRAEPVAGLLHRGAEKLFEVRDYRQILALANRHDWLGSFSGELGVCLAVEDALGIVVPERAVWIRTLLAELGRVASHLAFLGGCAPIGGPPAAQVERQAVLALTEEFTGGRIHVMIAQIGGLRADLPPGWLDRARHTVGKVRAGMPRLREAVNGQPLDGIGVLARADAEAFGASGVIARASGLDVDLRRDRPYLAYGQLFTPGGPGRVVTSQRGDARARLTVLAAQAEVALDLIEACADRLAAAPAGPVGVRLPKVVRVPEGQWYCAVESPLGMAGHLLVSRGDKTPWRLSLRTPSFANVAALAAALPGTRLEDLTTVVGSWCFVMGDVDK